MEATAAGLTSTASKTIADLLPRAVELYGERPAVQFKRDGEWRTQTFAEVGEIVRELALGLVDLGLEPGQRFSILANTRVEWTHVDFAITSAGGVVVPIYQTNSPEECEWVLADSGAAGVVCEDADQLAKVRAVRDRLPELRWIVVIDPAGDTHGAIGLDELRERGRAREATELEARWSAVSPEDPFTFIYTSGTTGPPKGCVLTHGNYRSVLDMCIELRVIAEVDESVAYLYLPLAHSYALLIQLLSFDVGGTVAYFGGDTRKIIEEIVEVRPTELPSVPRIFEKIYTLVTAHVDADTLARAVQVGTRVQDLRNAGQPVPGELEREYEGFDAELYSNVRAAFGGRLRRASSGAAPIATEILRFFWACGVPVMEGYGMTETSTVATAQTVDQHKFGTVGKPLPGVEVRIAEDGEVLLRGANIFRGYHNNADASFGAVEDGWLHTGDLGSLDEDGYLVITGRKKDIIITAGGKNLTPANIENELKQTRFVSQAVMHGDRRPYPVVLITLDEEEILPWARERGLPENLPSLAEHPDVRGLIQVELDRINARYAQVEQVKRFCILDHDLSQETGELTPTLKVKRNVVNEKYAALLDALYAEAP